MKRTISTWCRYAVVISFLISIPITIPIYSIIQNRWRKRDEGELESPLPDGCTPIGICICAITPRSM